MRRGRHGEGRRGPDRLREPHAVIPVVSARYYCCRTRYEVPALDDGDTDVLIRVLDAQHDAEHPRCSRANPPVVETHRRPES